MSPFKSKWGTCLIQSWVPDFNPHNPSNLDFPTWVSLRNLPFEHQDQALAIAETLGKVIGMDTANDTAKDPRFCINLEINKGWATSIDLESNIGILPPQRILIDYDKFPIRCRVCMSWKHKASDCKEFYICTSERQIYISKTKPTPRKKTKIFWWTQTASNQLQQKTHKEKHLRGAD